MTLAALISAGAPASGVEAALDGLNVPYGLDVEETEVSGVRSLRVTVSGGGEREAHVHRTFADVKEIIARAELPGRAAGRATEAFQRLAIAEGAVHGRSPEEVTFHEVGAVDSIVDTVGSCVALELLDAETVSCGPLPLGKGLVSSQHGLLPAPGPATLEVLAGSRVEWADEPHEMTTPTGAALMAALTAGSFGPAPQMVLRAAGYGAGWATLSTRPNLLRAVVGEPVDGTEEDLELLETNVDDAPGEFLGRAVDVLLQGGALDAWLEPVYMKRGRGAYKVCALVADGDRDRLARRLMRETGSLGVRHHPVGRTVANRRTDEVELPYGRCRVKVGSLNGEVFVVAPEYADAVRLAEKAGLPLPRVYEDARRAHAEAHADPE